MNGRRRGWGGRPETQAWLGRATETLERGGAKPILVQLRRLAERTPAGSTSKAAQAAPSAPAAEAEQAT
ncbi:MAG: hypothetical protein HY264_11315 [Chloroflexi bacterium]|nr:hypothetical protein [Chloroflexota bacterium]